MKIVEAKGTPRQVGEATGEQLRDEIREHLAMFPVQVPDEVWTVRLIRFVRALHHCMPAFLDELEGTAEGANLPADDIFKLNLPLYANDLMAEENCTNIVFGNGPDGPVWGKNNDGSGTGAHRPVCARIVRRNDSIPCVIFTFCGMAAVNDGMNAEGLAVGHSSVGSVFQQSDDHVPIRPWAYEGMLTCRTTAEFVRHFASRPTRGKGYSMVCVDRGGVSCSIEAPCPLPQVRRSQLPAGHLHCVNCYQLAHLAEADRRTPQGKKNAKARWRLLDDQLSAPGAFDVEHMKSILRYHGNPSICRHGGADGSMTEYSMIGVPRTGKVLYVDGPPCAGQFMEYEI